MLYLHDTSPRINRRKPMTTRVGVVRVDPNLTDHWCFVAESHAARPLTSGDRLDVLSDSGQWLQGRVEYDHEQHRYVLITSAATEPLSSLAARDVVVSQVRP